APAILERLKQQNQLVEVALGHARSRLLHADILDEIDRKLLDVLAVLHQESPLMTSHDRQKVQAQLDYIGDDALVQAAVDRLIQRKQVVGDRDLRRIARDDFKPKLSANLRKLKDRLVQAFKEARFQPPEPAIFAN